MTNLKFNFYSILKNEDATPFIGDNILVVADGLGGSGSSTHKIDRAILADIFGDIWDSAFGDISDTSVEFKEYANELIRPLSDDKDHTSASWASRIVIARCVYALTEGGFKDVALDDEKERAKLAEFIVRGLHDVAAKFNLQKGKYDGQLLLPTTLAFVRFVEREHSIIAETVWAGDSRCYALLPEGLKLLSVDDEDKSGAITNLFYYDNPRLHLNYLQHELGKPCALMAVSDGVFDPFDPHDHLGIEQTVLTMIEESDSIEELSDKLRRFFDKVHGDDATMAFASFGFSDFNELKNAVKQRAETISSIRQKQETFHDAIEAMNLSEEDAAHYVTVRATDRFEHIVPMLLDAIEHDQDDIAITDEIRDIVDKANKAQIDAIERKKAAARKKALDNLYEIVKDFAEPKVEEIFVKDHKKYSTQELSRALRSFKDAANNLIEQSNKARHNFAQSEELEEKKQSLHGKVQSVIDKYRKEQDELWSAADNDQVASRREELLNVLILLTNADNALKFPTKKNGKVVFNEDDVTRLNEKINQNWGWDIYDYIKERNELESNIKNCVKNMATCREKYLQSWDKLFQFIANEPKYELILNGTIRKKCGLSTTETSAQPDKAAVRGKVMQTLREQKSTVTANIVCALAGHFDETSLIDSQFNAPKLSLFRTYFELKYQPNDAVRDFYDSLTALENEYTSLLK